MQCYTAIEQLVISLSSRQLFLLVLWSKSSDFFMGRLVVTLKPFEMLKRSVRCHALLPHPHECLRMTQYRRLHWTPRTRKRGHVWHLRKT